MSERAITVVFTGFNALNEFLKGALKVQGGVMKAGTGGGFGTEVHDTLTFTAISPGVTEVVLTGDYLYDVTDNKRSIIGGVAAHILTVPVGTWAVGHSYEVRRPPITMAKIHTISQDDTDRWFVVYWADDGYTIV